MKKLTYGLLALLIVLIVLVVVFSVNRARAPEVKPLSQLSPTPTIKPTGNPYYRPGKHTFVVYVQNWSFNPTYIQVAQSDTVVLQFKSMDVKHGVSIAGYGINQSLEPFKLTNVEFVASKSGKFDITCTINCGPSGYQGMKGVLDVK